MLLPRFSIRVVFLVTAVWAVYFLMIGLAIRGSTWAAGVAIAGSTLIFAALVHAAMFALSYVVGKLFMRTPHVEGKQS